MNEATISRLMELGKHIGSPSDDHGRLRELERVLPDMHCSFLSNVNGLTVAHGAYRLFGVRKDEYLDLAHWNLDQTWRFAWGNCLHSYLFFGGTAWGDQYAYALDDAGLLAGPEVHFFEANSMRPEPFADSFEAFIEGDFLRNAIEPYDVMTIRALEKVGDVEPRNQWALSPSIVLGGSETVDNLITLPAATAMIFAGDIASAVDEASVQLDPTSVVPWTDSLGRPRLRVAFV